MNQIIKLCLLLLLSYCSIHTTQATPIDTFQFNDELTKRRFKNLSQALRCPKCQNQNLSDSNSPIATDLRLTVYNQLQQGKSDQQIIDFMLARYGDFVLYKPRITKNTYVLWFTPIGLILMGLCFVVFIIKKKPVQQYVLTQKNTVIEQQNNHLKTILKYPVNKNKSVFLPMGLLGFIIIFSGILYQKIGAYEQVQAQKLMPANITAKRAQALYDRNNQIMTPMIMQLLKKSLSLDKNDPTANLLLGMHHFSNKKYSLAVKRWEMVKNSKRNNIDITALTQAINEAKIRIQQGTDETKTHITMQQKIEFNLTLNVSLSDKVSATLSENKNIFVYAVTRNGARMPLSVVKIKSTELPQTIIFNNENIMLDIDSLASIDSVNVYAVLSQSGNAGIKAGDFKVQKNNIPISHVQTIELIIEKQVE
ncbi:cytochrome c-type biogenesis protein CcmH [Pseudoalteromonas denitrificans]|uniref:Cytochrome c-type biogenesis protein n=1 Tax=Pseudoalteromonas denitrificans DSM 6059 TaxID=1123010 RepID=A0A1I1FQK3_9GAMM|nr:cytochrome c-type biogenesis protein CcmH [Pseudoalteromonas denitrificans]SFC01727.1 Cytochrome c-type biogenesis protein CcmH/NrfF [Pseudoalteromonas denitrificans DSM 6059]